MTKTLLHVVTMLFDWDDSLLATSRCYDETWAEKLYRGFKRNLTIDFDFIVFTDRIRQFNEPIIQELMTVSEPGYGKFTEPYRLNEAMIFCGLDTVVLQNVDHLAEYCLSQTKIALSRNPYQPDQCINPVALVPPGHAHVFHTWNGENDMEWLRTFDVNYIDDLFPGQLLSLKFHDVRRKGTQDANIVYFHGNHKPHQLLHLPWVKEHWR